MRVDGAAKLLRSVVEVCVKILSVACLCNTSEVSSTLTHQPLLAFFIYCAADILILNVAG